jgi:hypothetical protein
MSSTIVYVRDRYGLYYQKYLWLTSIEPYGIEQFAQLETPCMCSEETSLDAACLIIELPV